MNKLLFIFLLYFISCSEKEIFNEFQKFITKYNKYYSSIEEYQYRYQIFKMNYEAIKTRNLPFEGVNKFSDLSEKEFATKYLTLNVSALPKDNVELVLPKFKNAPTAFDWRDQGAVSRVKDQASCGSCWAFSAVGNIEAINFLKTQSMELLSEQQLVDCSKSNNGCKGGNADRAFEDLKNDGGIEGEDDYPYVAEDQECHFDSTKVKVKIQGYERIGSLSEVDILNFLYETGPLTACINAKNLHSYTQGILDVPDEECDPDNLNHAVLLVGYGNENGLDYWIVKNSWGDNFGEEGYFRIVRGKGTCGINRHVSSSII